MKYKIEIKRKAQKALAKISDPYQTNINANKSLHTNNLSASVFAIGYAGQGRS